MDAQKIASFLIQYFNSTGEPLTNLKLQKLLYYLQVWYLVHFKGEILFKEIPEAWVHGPVYPSVYATYRDSNGAPIVPTHPLSDKEINTWKKEIFPSKNEKLFFDTFVQYYGIKGAFALELMTHNEDPWKNARKGLSPLEPSHNKIDLGFAEKYYRKLIS